MTRKFFAAVALGLLTSGTALAGWNSGGGELFKDGLNPWFIQNTKTVSACIEVDTDHFHYADGTDLKRDYIDKVLAYWKGQFAGQRVNSEFPTWPRTATQRFEFGPCTDETEVRFQFGVLSPAQLKQFDRRGQDPRDFLSLAVRTDYDRVSLRGKGFVYIAPDSGPLKPYSSDIIDRPWSANGGIRLVKVLAHEVGHIFGVAHTSSGPDDGALDELMSAQYPEAIVRKRFADDSFIVRPDIPPFFTEDLEATSGSCVIGDDVHFSQRVRQFLVLPPEFNCIWFKRKDGIIDVFGSKYADGSAGRQRLGTITLNDQKAYIRAENPIHMWLPPEQTIVHVPEGYVLNVGPDRVAWSDLATYEDVSHSVRRSVHVTVFPGTQSISAEGITDSGRLFYLFETSMPKARKH